MSNRNLFMKSQFPHFVLSNLWRPSIVGGYFILYAMEVPFLTLEIGEMGQLLLILKMQFFGKDVHALILTIWKCVTYMADVIKAVDLGIGRIF